jgi:hypothetical protein
MTDLLPAPAIPNGHTVAGGAATPYGIFFSCPAGCNQHKKDGIAEAIPSNPAIFRLNRCGFM